MDEDRIVMIKLTWKTREKLKALGKKGDSYDTVVKKMLAQLDFYHKRDREL